MLDYISVFKTQYVNVKLNVSTLINLMAQLWLHTCGDAHLFPSAGTPWLATSRGLAGGRRGRRGKPQHGVAHTHWGAAVAAAAAAATRSYWKHSEGEPHTHFLPLSAVGTEAAIDARCHYHTYRDPSSRTHAGQSGKPGRHHVVYGPIRPVTGERHTNCPFVSQSVR